MSNYKIAVGPWLTGPVQELTFYQSWTLDTNLDDGCTFSFTVPTFAPETEYISELDTDVWVYRGGQLDQRFRIIQVSQSWGSSGEDVVTVQAVCYRRLLGSRYVLSPLRFDQVSQGDIIWGLIDHTQSQLAGNLGIAVGGLGPTVLRDRSYEVGQNILDLIVDLTNVIDGPTWEIDENLQLQVSQAGLFPLNPMPIVLGATASAMVRPSGASKFANVAVVSGSNEQTSTVVKELWTLATDPRGRWERRASFPSAVIQDTLQDHADGLVSDYQSPTTIWQVEVVPDRYFDDAQYKLGDLVRLIQPRSVVASIGDPAPEIDGQVVAIQIQQDSSGSVDVSMRVLEIANIPPEPPPIPPDLEVTVTGALSDVTADGYRTVVWDANGSLQVENGSINIEYLVLAGGGGGGAGRYIYVGPDGFLPGYDAFAPGGGGGAGGLLQNNGAPLLTVPPSTYAVAVGSGGLGRTTTVYATNGGNSSVGTLLVAQGGGFGGTSSNGNIGGSGGGGSSDFLKQYGGNFGGSGTANQGTKGGNTPWGGGGGGGGGRTSVGGAGTTSAGGNGGSGYTSSLSGTTVVYAGGGGGGRAPADIGGTGTDGGGNGGAYETAGANATGYGSGGGGGGAPDTNIYVSGGNGSAGRIIIRFAV